MKKYIVSVFVRDNKRFGIGEKTLDFLVLDNSNPVELVGEYLKRQNFDYFRIVASKRIEKDVSLESIYEILS